MNDDIQSNRSRETVLQAAFTALAADPTASLAEIAAAAGVGRATLHRHFAGRDDLMRAMALRALDELDTAVEQATRDAPSHTDALRLSLHAMIPLAARHWFLANDDLSDDPEIAAAYEKDAAEMRMTIEGARAEGTFAADVPTPWIVASFEALLFTAWEQVRAGELTPKQASALAWRTLTTGLKGPAE